MLTESKEQAKISVKVSIMDIVNYNQSGDLITNDIAGDPIAGIKGHQLIQKARPEPYQAEVLVTKTIEGDLICLYLSGRIDGILDRTEGVVDSLIQPLTKSADLFSQPLALKTTAYQDQATNNLAIIEEIKTHYQPYAQISETKKNRYLAQVKLYAFIWAQANARKELIIQLTYYDLIKNSLSVCRYKHTIDELGVFFKQQTNAYLEWLEYNYKLTKNRNQSIKQLKFPYPSFRSNQRQIAKQVYLSASHQQPIMIEAPTGLGKTIAVLYGGLKALAFEKIENIYFLTAKNAGADAVIQNLKVLTDNSLQITVLQMVAKDKLCPLMKSCDNERCEYAFGYYDRLNSALYQALSNQLIDIQLLIAIAEEHRLCPHAFMFDLSRWVDLVIADYNYFLDPLQNRFVDVKKQQALFLADESHNIIERVRELYSAEIDLLHLQSIKPFIGSELRKPINALLTELSQIKDQLLQKDPNATTITLTESEHTVYTEQLDAKLFAWLQVWQGYIQTIALSEIDEAVLNLSQLLYKFTGIKQLVNNHHALLANISVDNLTLHYYCLNPGYYIAQQFQQSSLVLFSATLSPIHYYKQLLLHDSDPKHLKVPAVFTAEQQLISIIPFINVRYHQRQNTLPLIIQLINTVVELKPGHYLVFFPSYAYLEQVYEAFTKARPDILCRRQIANMSLHEQQDFIEALKKPQEGQSLIGFAILGGILSESINLPKEQLIGSIIISVSLGEKNQQREAIKDYYQHQQQPGYDLAYRLPGMNRVLQAAGRVIRSEQDKGIICLVDDRFTHTEYRNLLPQEWQLRLMKNMQELANGLVDFWH